MFPVNSIQYFFKKKKKKKKKPINQLSSQITNQLIQFTNLHLRCWKKIRNQFTNHKSITKNHYPFIHSHNSQINSQIFISLSTLNLDLHHSLSQINPLDHHFLLSSFFFFFLLRLPQTLRSVIFFVWLRLLESLLGSIERGRWDWGWCRHCRGGRRSVWFSLGGGWFWVCGGRWVMDLWWWPVGHERDQRYGFVICIVPLW